MLDEIYNGANYTDGIFEADVLFAMVDNFKKLIENPEKALRIVNVPEKMVMEN